MAVRSEVGGGDVVELRSAAAAEALLLDVVHRHADELLRIARTHSLCADDAHDAYQRSLEQFLRHGRRLRLETAEKWLFKVCKREAQAIRRARSQLVGSDEVDFDRLEARHDASPEDHALAADAVTRSAEALRSLKPQEVRALWLRADGRSYAEIQAATGWSYTKVNRCLTEGRRTFLKRCAALEAGAECERWGGVLAALAGGHARSDDLAALRPHLRHCAGCRATLRALHDSSASVATVLPPGLVGTAAVDGDGGAERFAAAARWLTRLYEGLAGPVQERAATGALKWQAAVEAAAAGKVAAVAASTVALAGGGTVVAHDAERPAGGRADPKAAAPTQSGRDARAATRGRPAPAVRAPERAVPRPAAPVVRATASRPSVRAGKAGSGRVPPATREFGVSARSASRPAQAEFPARPARAVRTIARVRAAPAPVTPVAPPVPAGTEFAPAAPAARTNPAPSRAARPPRGSVPAAPAVAEFGP